MSAFSHLGLARVTDTRTEPSFTHRIGDESINFEGDVGLRLDRERRGNLRRDGGGCEEVGTNLRDRDMAVGSVSIRLH